jgi:hypothetical protein
VTSVRGKAAVNRLRKLRVEADERVCPREHVVGSMIALKQVDGSTTQRLGLTFLVAEKIPLGDLRPRDRVPKTLSIAGKRILTDVMVWPRMAEQALSSSYVLTDGRMQGTLSCFARTALDIYGLTCAHCQLGVDGNPTTATPIEVYVPEARRFLPLGQSVISIFAPGSGHPSDFGYADCGLFTMSGPMRARANQASPLQAVADIRTLLGTILQGHSMLDPTNVPTPVRQAKVVGIDKQALDERADIVLDVGPPGTFRGDSGMLWLTANGSAAAIHCRGELMPPGVGSRWTTAMSARRAQEMLRVDLAWG